MIYVDIGQVSGGGHRINYLSDDKVEYAELKHQDQPKHFSRSPDIELIETQDPGTIAKCHIYFNYKIVTCNNSNLLICIL